MAVGLSTLPRIPPFLQELRRYLHNRDVGAPNVDPVPQTISTAALTGQTCQAFEVDTLTWLYSQPVGLWGRRADGFILCWENADTAEPAGARVRLSIEATSHQMWWPAGATRSYSIAAFRNTWQGEQVGAHKQLDGWKGVSTTLVHVLPVVPVSETITNITGASHTVTNMIPAGCYPIACYTTNLTAISGATSYQVGLTGNLDAWGAAVSVADGAGNATTAFTYLGLGFLRTSATHVIITANGPNFAGGNIAVRLLYVDPALC